MAMSRTLSLTLALLAALPGCATRRDTFAPPAHGFTQEVPGEQPVTLLVEHPGGEQFQMFPYGSSMYVAGEEGAHYVLRLVNNTPERVEVVVTVDGRDVVSGELGDFKKQRGYIIEPFGSIPIEGFRTSLDSVAAFRFASLGHSYTAQRGTPQHVGVIGVAVFKEKPRKEKDAPIALAPRPYFEPGRASQAPAGGGEPFPESPSESAAADEAAPAKRSSAPSSEAEDASGAFAPDAAPPSAPRHHELGTEFGEAQFSSVHQVEFKRDHKRKPDAFMTLYYDTMEGLEARGVVPSSGAVGFGDPDPFPAQAR
jgi:hypothetical protein